LPRDNLVGTLTGVLCVLQMNEEKLKKMQNAVRIGGKGTPRRKKKVVHATAATDDKKLQSSLKKLSVRGHPSCPYSPPSRLSPRRTQSALLRSGNRTSLGSFLPFFHSAVPLKFSCCYFRSCFSDLEEVDRLNLCLT
jgi:hypothetical protein